MSSERRFTGQCTVMGCHTCASMIGYTETVGGMKGCAALCDAHFAGIKDKLVWSEPYVPEHWNDEGQYIGLDE